MELIKTTDDKLGREVKVYFTAAGDMPAKVTTFFLRGWAQLIEDGHSTPNYVEDTTGKRIIYLEVDSSVVAILVWEWINTVAFINFTFISSEHRGVGLYTILFDAFDKRVKDGGATQSKSQVHAANTKMLEASVTRGYGVEYYRLVKRY